MILIQVPVTGIGIWYSGTDLIHPLLKLSSSASFPAQKTPIGPRSRLPCVRLVGAHSPVSGSSSGSAGGAAAALSWNRFHQGWFSWEKTTDDRAVSEEEEVVCHMTQVVCVCVCGVSQSDVALINTA